MDRKKRSKAKHAWCIEVLTPGIENPWVLAVCSRCEETPWRPNQPNRPVRKSALPKLGCITDDELLIKIVIE